MLNENQQRMLRLIRNIDTSLYIYKYLHIYMDLYTSFCLSVLLNSRVHQYAQLLKNWIIYLIVIIIYLKRRSWFCNRQISTTINQNYNWETTETIKWKHYLEHFHNLLVNKKKILFESNKYLTEGNWNFLYININCSSIFVVFVQEFLPTRFGETSMMLR